MYPSGPALFQVLAASQVDKGDLARAHRERVVLVHRHIDLTHGGRVRGRRGKQERKTEREERESLEQQERYVQRKRCTDINRSPGNSNNGQNPDRERHTDRERDRHTQREKEIDTRRERQRQTDKQTDSERERAARETHGHGAVRARGVLIQHMCRDVPVACPLPYNLLTRVKGDGRCKRDRWTKGDARDGTVSTQEDSHTRTRDERERQRETESAKQQQKQQQPRDTLREHTQP